LLEAPRPPAPLNLGFILSQVLFGLGWLLFAIATLRAQVYRRAAAALLAIGAVLAAISLPFTAIILSVAVGWLGYPLYRDRRHGRAAISTREMSFREDFRSGD